MNECKTCGECFEGSGVLCPVCKEIHDSRLRKHIDTANALIAELEADSRRLREALILRNEENDTANALIADLEAAQQWHDMDDLPPVDDDGHARFEVVVDDYVTIGEYNEYKKIPWHDETGSQISPRLWRELPPMQGKE